MEQQSLAWIVFGTYVVATTGLALWGMRKTTDLKGFALGNGDLGPVLTGITLAAAIASTATFVINPGFVYAHGISALMHLGVASFAGVILGLVFLSKGFRSLGVSGRALTLPHWMEARYGHRGLRSYFALLNLVLAISFVVLIVKGSALLMEHVLGLSYVPALSIIVGFVFSYVLLGGTYAHVYTNALQGGLMVIVALVIVASGFPLLGDGLGPFLERIGSQDPNLLLAVNPQSSLFNSAWSVYACGFVVGVALVAQPHILTKSLYLRGDRDLRRYLWVGAVVCVIYAGVLLAGLYARAMFPEIAAQDAVMPIYLSKVLGPTTGVFVSVALLAAGMSTLDGILVSASTIAANDILLGALGDRLLADKAPAEREALAFKASRYILIAMGVVAFLIALDPPRLVGIFAQVGIYGLVAASLGPVLLGIFAPRFGARPALVAALVGPAVHFLHYGIVVWYGGGTLNPAVSATSGILASLLASSAYHFATQSRAASSPVLTGTPNGEHA